MQFDTAIVETKTMDLSALDGAGFGADSADVLIADAPQPTNILTDNNPHKALDVPDKPTKGAETKEAIVPISIIPNEKEVGAILDAAATELVINDEQLAEGQTKGDEGKGRPKIDKSALVSYLTAKIEANEYGIPADAAFDATKQTPEQYLSTLPEKELHTLLDANVKAQVDEVRANTPKEFFDSLPEELQYAAAYVAEGGQDLKALFKALSYVEEIKELDPNKESDQLQIARSYLQAKQFGTEEQIAEQLEEWKTTDKLPKKALEFKPALDDMQKQQVEAHLKAAEEQRKQQGQLQQYYVQHVNKALENNEIAGVKLDKKFSKDLVNNMVYTVPGPFSGKPVNYLGYGLEKAQYVEPDFEAVLLAAMILNDKKGTLAQLRIPIEAAQTEKIAKLVKLNQGLGVSEQPVLQQKTIKRLPNMSNVLKRA